MHFLKQAPSERWMEIRMNCTQQIIWVIHMEECVVSMDNGTYSTIGRQTKSNLQFARTLDKRTRTVFMIIPQKKSYTFLLRCNSLFHDTLFFLIFCTVHSLYSFFVLSIIHSITKHRTIKLYRFLKPVV